MEEDKKTASCPEEEDAANIAVNVESSNDSHHPNSHLLPPDRYDWQTVPNRSTHDSSHTVSQYTAATETRRGHNRSRRAANTSVPRGFLSQRRPKRGQFNNSVASKADKKAPNQSEVVKRPGRGPCGRGKRGRGRGREEQARRSGAEPRALFAISQGFIQPDIKYEWNELYVLGLHYKTSQDSLKNYIHIISGYEVDFVRWFKPKGKAIVKLKTEKIKDFQDILRAQEKKPTLDGVRVLIERAPQCKSIYVSGFPPCTSKVEAQMYFEERVGALDPARGVEFSPRWDEPDEKCRVKRAIVYFDDKESRKKALKKDHFLDRDAMALRVVAFYPFLGTVNPVDPPKGSKRPISGDPESSRLPQFYKHVDPNLMEFIMESNQERKLKGALVECEKAYIQWKTGDSYALIKYAEKKLDNEFEEPAWKERCIEIVDSCLNGCAAKEIPVDEEIWGEVANQLPQIECQVLSKYTAKVKLMETSHTLSLICLRSNMPDFADKLTNRLKKIEEEVRERKMEEKIRKDISPVKLQLLQNAKIESILKEEFKEDVRAEVKLGDHTLVLKTPKGLMLQVTCYLRQRLDEIDKCAIDIPPEIVDILKRKPGRKKMVAELPAGCAFTLDEKAEKVIFLGKNPPQTKQGSETAKSVLVCNQTLTVTTRDISLLLSDKWSDLCRKLEKRHKIRISRELQHIAVFGFEKDVTEAVTKMRDFFNEKKATEGEFPLDALQHRRIFNEFFKEDIEELEGELADYGVKISFEDNGKLIKFSGSEEGVKEVEERLYAMQDKIKEETFRIYTPGMRTFLGQDGGRRLIEMVEREKKCIINVTDSTGEEEGDDDEESESDESLSNSCDREEIDENEKTILTSEDKIVTWKTGKIEEEQADVLVCSVGSNLMLSVGAIANAMSKAAGPELQLALLEAAKEATADLDEGDIISTIPGKLSCRHVIHCLCCPWKDGSNEKKQVLRELLWKCFDRASEMGACSIGLPLIGTGGLGFPHAVAVHIMIRTAIDHSQANPKSPIEEFRFVVFSEDLTGIEAIEEEFFAFKKERQSMRKYQKQNVPQRNPTPLLMPELKNKCTLWTGLNVDCGQLKLQVVEGDITKEFAEAICNVVFQDLDMRGGSLSSSIAEVCGNIVQEELQVQLPHQPGDIVITSAGIAPAMKKIVHIVVGDFKKKHLQICVEKALKKADSVGLRSLSIPAVGSGRRLGFSAEESAEIVFTAIRAFAANSCASIREVKIVVQDDSITGAFVAKLEAIQKENGKSLNQCEKNDVEAATGCGRGKLEDSTDESTACFRHQNVVIHGRIESLQEAMTALKDGVTKACNNPRIIKHDVLSRLSKRRIKELKRKSRDRDVKMEQLEECCIRLEGLPKDVMDLNTEINDAIQEQRESEHKEEKAEQMFRTVRWCMTNAAGKEEPFDKIANYDIELAYQAKEHSQLISHKNLEAEIHFGSKEVTFLRNGKIKSIRRRDVLPLPNEWVAHPRDEHDKEEPLHLVSLLRESEDFRRIKDKFLESLSNKMNILSIERIQNPSLYVPYMARKQSMDEKNGTLDNELQLFHGTKYESVKAINLQGFNRSLCGQNGAAYGDGVYFAKQAFYSRGYSKKGPRGECYMYLAKVLVGKYTTGEQEMKAPPSRDKSKPEILFDSVVDDADNPTIFVVFNDFHVYPEYLITFKINE
ncbi:uncharacterized protein [Montipora capricornis]|uniref:uncharacterized protein n=1 Tax=Montipora capricornis TaxID=246305 RepID=UPI0035F1817B